METLNTSTTEQLNNLIEFRQTVYDHILVGVRDAQFELVDAVLLSDQVGCFAELSLSPAFRRRWSSAYSAVQEGNQALEKLEKSFIEQVPREGVQVFPLDTTMWAHPRARTLSGLVYGRSPTKALKRHSIVQGHQYSLLTWTPEPGRSWSLPISSQRVGASQSAIEVGVAQVKALCQTRLALKQADLDVIVADGHYGNHRFFGPLQEYPVRPWPGCIGTGFCMAHRVRTVGGVGLGSTGLALPSKSQTPGPNQTSRKSLSTNVGVPSGCGAGITCTPSKMQKPALMLF